MNNKYICCVTGREIPQERVEALEFLGIPQDQWTVAEASFIKKFRLPTEGAYRREDAVITEENITEIIGE